MLSAAGFSQATTPLRSMMYDGTFTSVIARSTSLPRLWVAASWHTECLTSPPSGRTAEQVPVEEAHDSALVLLRRGAETGGHPPGAAQYSFRPLAAS